MSCHAVIHAVLDRERTPPVTTFVALRADPPLVPRATVPSRFEPWVQHSPGAARCVIASGAAGPLGGDSYTLDLVVEAGATVVAREASATVALPGPHGEPSQAHYRFRVDTGATLIWDPEPVIAAAGCTHTQRIDVELAADSRLFFREELQVGRHNESPGDITTQISVQRAGAPVLVQSFALGPRSSGWDSGAVLGRHRAVGSLLICDPGGAPTTQERILDRNTIVAPIDPYSCLVTAVGENNLAVRRALDAYLVDLGPPWGVPTAAAGWYPVPR